MHCKLGFIGDEAGYDIQKQISFCKMNHLKSIHVRSVNGKLLNEYSTEVRKNIFDQIEQQEIHVDCVLSKIGKYPIADQMQWAEEMEAYIQICESWKSRYLRIFGYGMEHEEVVNKMVSKARERGIMILIENETNTPMNTVEECTWILEKYDYKMGLLLDVGNLFLEHGDCVTFYQKLKKHIFMIQLKELYLNDQEKYIGCELEKGCIHTKKLLDQLKRDDFSGELVLESYHKIPNQMPEKRFQRQQEIYDSFVAYFM